MQPTTQKELEDACLTKKACVVVQHPGKLGGGHMKALRDTMQKFRNVTFAFVNSKQREVQYGVQIPAPENVGSAVMIYLNPS
jgi:hypothetical protein